MKKFSLDGYDMRNIEHCADELIDIVSSLSFHIVLKGSVGTGKTMLAGMIADYLNSHTEEPETGNVRIKGGYTAKMYSSRKEYRKYLSLVRSSDKARVIDIERQENIMHFNNVILDDIGTEFPSTDAAHQYIGFLLEDRYDYIRENKNTCTVFTTNLSATGTNSLRTLYGDRVVNRLYEKFIIVVFGNHSFRLDDIKVWKGKK